MTTNAKNSKRDPLVLPYAATSEDKAEQFAAAIELLLDVKAKVFEDGEKWGVAVVEKMERINDPLNNERIVSAVILLSNFDLAEETGMVCCISQHLCDLPEAQKELTRRARHQLRIEDKLDAILTVLVGIEGAKALERSMGDAHRLPAAPPRMSRTGK